MDIKINLRYVLHNGNQCQLVKHCKVPGDDERQTVIATLNAYAEGTLLAEFIRQGGLVELDGERVGDSGTFRSDGGAELRMAQAEIEDDDDTNERVPPNSMSKEMLELVGSEIAALFGGKECDSPRAWSFPSCLDATDFCKAMTKLRYKVWGQQDMAGVLHPSDPAWRGWKPDPEWAREAHVMMPQTQAAREKLERLELIDAEVERVKQDGAMERLAEAEHASWARWAKYMIDAINTECIEEGAIDAGVVMRLSCMDRWARQMNTPYSELSDKEKESDRKVVLEKLGHYAAALRSQDFDPLPVLSGQSEGELEAFKNGREEGRKDLAAMVVERFKTARSELRDTVTRVLRDLGYDGREVPPIDVNAAAESALEDFKSFGQLRAMLKRMEDQAQLEAFEDGQAKVTKEIVAWLRSVQGQHDNPSKERDAITAVIAAIESGLPTFIGNTTNAARLENDEGSEG